MYDAFDMRILERLAGPVSGWIAGTVARPPIRWWGSKWRLAPWIMGYFPPHVCYVEPFGGGANVLLRKSPAEMEIYNDADGEVVNFFRVLRERTQELMLAIQLTPHARDELALARQPTGEPLERARRFYVRAWQAYHAGRVHEDTGWRLQYQNNRGKSIIADWNNTDKLWPVVARLKQVQIEHTAALSLISRVDTPRTLFYLDPPYVISTRSPRRGYGAYSVDMTDDDHRQLAEVLHQVKGMVVLSGYASALYDELFAGWKVVKKSMHTNGNVSRMEHLWLSPNTVAALERERMKDVHELPLFAALSG